MAGDNPGIIEAYGRSPLLDICEVWPVGRLDPEANEPVISEVPTLILYGDYDAYTSPSLVKNAGARSTHRLHRPVPVQRSQSLRSRVPEELPERVGRRAHDPTDTGCIGDMPAPVFTLPEHLGSHQASDWPRPPAPRLPLAPGPALHRRRDGLASSGGDVPQDARGRSTPSGLVDGTSRLATRRERSRLPGARGRRALAER